MFRSNQEQWERRIRELEEENHKLQHARREAENRYRTLFSHSRDIVFLHTINGAFLEASDVTADILGYTLEELKNINVMDLIGESQHEIARASLKELLETGVVSNPVEYQLRRKDGGVIWLEVMESLVYREGKPYAVQGIARDITGRRLAEKELRESETLYRTIFEHTTTANIIIGEDTIIKLANSNFARITGYSRDELEGKMSWTVLVMPGDLEKMRQYHEQRRIEPDSLPQSYEFNGIIRSGEQRHFFMNVAMVPGSTDSIASLIDITERKKSEERVRQSEQRFRNLAYLLPETIFETDLLGRIIFVNKASLERFGFTPEDLEKGIYIKEIIHPDEFDRALNNIQRVFKGESVGLIEYTIQRKDGSTFPAMIHSICVMENDKPTGLMGFLVDMSGKKQIEQQLLRSQKMQAIGTLAGGIAHDFNNLLMGILGNIAIMLMSCDEEHDFYERLKNIEEYVKRGSDLTKQLLGFARGGKYEVKSTDLARFISHSASIFGRTKKEISIKTDFKPDILPVEVDRGQIEQVLINLFMNAWQAMPEGGVLYLGVQNAKLFDEEAAMLGLIPGDFVKITVRDTGAGMDDETKFRIFEPFFSTKERTRGTGLGLASAYGIIKNHGGIILVDSELGAGTTFTIYLPASSKPVDQEVQESADIQKGRETVLLIDDESMIIDVGTYMLNGLGYTVLSAGGGREGLHVYEQNRDAIALVILDVVMPDLGGRETFNGLIALNPAVKVLLSSGYSLDKHTQEIMSAGCKGFIQKPFNMSELSQKIREILDK